MQLNIQKQLSRTFNHKETMELQRQEKKEIGSIGAEKREKVRRQNQ